MSYSSFTLRKAKEELNLNFVEGVKFLPDLNHIHPIITPSHNLTEFLLESIPLAIAMGSEKARSELIISPILFELRKQLNRKISFFSGEEFNVDESIGLNGVCDFLISRSTEQLFVESPVVAIVEAKKDDLKSGLGQCIAEMVAAQRFNWHRENAIDIIYGCVTSGNRWIFLELKDQTLTIDLEEYVVPPVDWLLNALAWMCKPKH
ncbi:MAG: hypothetical protein WCP16_01390 [Pseudanabaena sp. ELA645]|jgi:hypothetical protein